MKDIERFHDRIAYLEKVNDRFQREIERLRAELKEAKTHYGVGASRRYEITEGNAAEAAGGD